MTITHIAKGSPWLWVHFVLMICVVGVVHFGISKMEEKLRITRFQDGSMGVDVNVANNSVAIFTIMVQGVPKMLAADKGPLEEYFQHWDPGKVYKVVVPFDLCSLEDLASRRSKVQNDISWLEARLDARNLSSGSDDDENSGSSGSENLCNKWGRKLKDLWARFVAKLGFTDEDRLRKLQNLKWVLGTKLMDYKERRATGAGIAFVIFKDVYTTNKAVKGFRAERKKKLFGQDCKRIEQYMSASFLSRSCLSALAFLIISTFLRILFYLLALIPWIKRERERVCRRI